MNILNILFFGLIHVTLGFQSLNDLEEFYRMRPTYDPYGAISRIFKPIK